MPSNGIRRIAMLSVYWGKGFGVASVIRSQVEKLPAFGFEIDVFAIHAEGFGIIEGVRIFEIPGNLYGLSQILSGSGYDFVIAHTPPFHALLATLEGVRTILYDHGEPPAEWFPAERSMRESLLKNKRTEVLPRVDRVVAISQFIADSIDWPKAIVLLNGADHLRTRYAGKKLFTDPNRLPTVLCVSRLGAGEQVYKGIDRLVALAADLKGRVRVILAGKGNTSDRLDLEKKGLEVHLNPSDEDLAGLYASVDAVVSFSRWEGFNLPLVEGGFYGRPGYALDVGAHKEVTPFIFESYEKLKAKLGSSTTGSLHEDGRRMLEFVSKFTWDANVRGLVSILDGLGVPETPSHVLSSASRLRIRMIWTCWKWLRLTVRRSRQVAQAFKLIVFPRGRVSRI